MALIPCKECGTEVSNKAKTCPKCGARVKRSELWKLIFIPIILFGIFFAIGLLNPESPEKRQDRRVYKHCIDSMNDQLASASAREAARVMCSQLRADFVRKHGHEP